MYIYIFNHKGTCRKKAAARHRRSSTDSSVVIIAWKAWLYAMSLTGSLSVFFNELVYSEKTQNAKLRVSKYWVSHNFYLKSVYQTVGTSTSILRAPAERKPRRGTAAVRRTPPSWSMRSRRRNWPCLYIQEGLWVNPINTVVFRV